MIYLKKYYFNKNNFVQIENKKINSSKYYMVKNDLHKHH